MTVSLRAGDFRIDCDEPGCLASRHVSAERFNRGRFIVQMIRHGWVVHRKAANRDLCPQCAYRKARIDTVVLRGELHAER